MGAAGGWERWEGVRGGRVGAARGWARREGWSGGRVGAARRSREYQCCRLAETREAIVEASERTLAGELSRTPSHDAAWPSGGRGLCSCESPPRPVSLATQIRLYHGSRITSCKGRRQSAMPQASPSHHSIITQSSLRHHSGTTQSAITRASVSHHAVITQASLRHHSPSLGNHLHDDGPIEEGQPEVVDRQVDRVGEVVREQRARGHDAAAGRGRATRPRRWW